jgi:hypothetical protein
MKAPIVFEFGAQKTAEARALGGVKGCNQRSLTVR